MDRLDLSRIKNLSLSMPSMKNLKLMSWITREGTEEEAMSSPRDLQDFLAEAQLEHYLSGLRNELKITCVDHLKYVKEDDLEAIGMAKPEMRRLKKFYKKECPQGTFGKLKKAIMRGSDGPGRSLSPSPPEHRISRPTSVIRPPGKQIIPQESIAVNKTLGEGEFGVVQQGVWTTEDGDKVQVAIKCLSKDRLQNGTQEFLKEASVQQSIDNENIVRLYGVVINKDNALMLVTELAPMRSLLECLKETSLRLDFPIPRLCDFAQQICDGMSYLESKRLIHRDLAARNILVFSKNKVKISDFGLSRALGVGKDYYQSNFSINLKLPIAWCAPECINYLKFTSYSDVWAYAVTLWELFTYGFQPWAGMSGQQDPAKAILEAIDMPNNQRLEKPDLCPVEYYHLMMKCWEHEPEERPTFSQIFLKLPQIRPVQVKAVKDYPQVTLEKDHLYYKSYDVIITIDKKPSNAPSIGLWKGALNNGKSGYFDPTNTVPFIEPKTSPISLPKTNLTRKESSRKSSRKLRVDMISGPQNDLRHTGHIGYDGAVFGDVGFIGEAYDKLPARGKAGDESVRSSMTSIDHRDSPDREGYRGTNGYGHSWMSSESLDSHHGEDRQYQDIDDDGILADFKIPDLTSSLDLGPSFMDEVLRALDEKERKLEGCSTEPSPSNGGSKLDDLTLTDFDRSRSVSPGGDGRPPPLPTSPPRVEPRRSDSRSEPKKQAKVKPMSASDEKMMESAIALANEFASQNQMRDSQSPPTSPTTKTEKKRTESESSSDSPNLMSKLKKISIKRSPKQERKRTFSDDMNNKSDLDGELPPEAQEAYNMLVVRGSCKDNDESSENSRQSSERASPASDAVVSNSSEIHLSQPKPSPIASSVNFRPPLPATEPRPPPPKPTPRPRIDPKKSEIPVPRPRPEVVQRVEPTQINRVEPTPRIGLSMSVDVPDTKTETKAESSLSLSVQRQQSLPESKSREREELKKTIEIVRVDSPRREEKVEVSASSSEDLASKSDSDREPPKSFFDEDFSEPSPREIMSKLREKRVTRSLDHQRGVSGDGEPAPTRSLREPQGIPGKGPSAPSTPAEEEEVDTNPLRMLRGGAIPIRTGRGAPGTNTKHSLRYPKLQFSNPQFQRMISDPGDRWRQRHFNPDPADVAPAVPPRTYSCSDSNNNNTVPLPPRDPLRPSSLHTRPRERKYPLLLSPQSPGRTSFSYSVSYRQPSSSSHVHEPPPDLPPAPPTPLHQEFDADDDNVFSSSSPPRSPLLKPVQRPVKKYYVGNVQCSLDQLGFYNKLDPFWVQTVVFPERSYSDNESSEDVSPLLLVNYKNSENVSYEDLLDFALDREKNCEEIEMLQRIFSTEVSVAECMKALELTKWDMQKTIKYIKMKQLLSLQLADIHRCKAALMISSWDVSHAADYLLTHPIPSPESLDV